MNLIREEGGAAKAWATRVAIEVGRSKYMLAVHVPTVKPNISNCPNPTMTVSIKFFKRLLSWHSMIVLLPYHLKHHRRICIQ